MSYETSESTAAIYAREDDRKQSAVFEDLRAGAVLYRPNSGLPAYYVRLRDGTYGMGNLTKGRVHKLAKAGVLELIGVETYTLAAGAVLPDPAPQPPEPVVVPEVKQPAAAPAKKSRPVKVKPVQLELFA